MALSEAQRTVYEDMLKVTRQEIGELDEMIEAELAKVKERLAELQQDKKAAQQMYEVTCLRLGIPNDLEEDDDLDDEV